MFNDIFLYSNFALNIGCLIVGLIIDRFVRKFLELLRYESCKGKAENFGPKFQIA